MNRKLLVLITLCIFLITGAVIGYLTLFQDHKKYYTLSAYLPLWKEWSAEKIQGTKFTHIHLAFAGIDQDYKITFKNIKQFSTADLESKIRSLRSLYPDLKITLSVGGWGAEGFSDMASRLENRKAFIESLTQFLKDFNLNGADIDWEHPVNGGWGIIKSRPEDRENFTLLMSELKESLNKLGKETGKHYELSYAASSHDWGIKNLEFHKVVSVVDYIHIMTYDYTGPWSKNTGHNAGLYKNGHSDIPTNTRDVIELYLSEGAPKDKVVLGIAAFGHGWEGVASQNNGLFQPAEKPLDSNTIDLSYRSIKENYLGKNGFTRFWDNTAKVPYLFNGSTFITYDDPESVALKVSYAKKKHLAGIMYWEYLQDANHELLDTMHMKLGNEK
ncbi:MAG: glycoside hydrolase family 18 protein [Clostridia bacterium]|nr:glycoside hydrolase family 18 protein [Clostridia bacterium]